MLIGREQELLHRAYKSEGSQFVAVYGRRRVAFKKIKPLTLLFLPFKLCGDTYMLNMCKTPFVVFENFH